MTDTHSKEQRSFNMSRIKSKNTKPEMLLFKLLKSSGYKFKKHYAITGKPDIAFPELKVAVFIDGEFWHGKDFNKWKNKLDPYWFKKISNNIKRDRQSRKQLKNSGWKIIKLWGRKIIKDPNKASAKIIKYLTKS